MKGRPDLGVGKRREAGCEEVDVDAAKGKEPGLHLESKTSLDIVSLRFQDSQAVVLGLR